MKNDVLQITQDKWLMMMDDGWWLKDYGWCLMMDVNVWHYELQKLDYRWLMTYIGWWEIMDDGRWWW